MLNLEVTISMAKYVLSAEEKKFLNKGYLYSLNTFMAFNQVVMEGKSFGMSILPALEVWYKDDPEEKKRAFARNANEFFNTHQAMQGLITGIVLAMEKERAEKGEPDEGAISGLKASLMGPLAGVGDSIFFNCFRVIIAGICIGLAADGSVLAPILFFVVYGCGLLVLKYWFLIEGYRSGVGLVNMAYERGIMPLIMEACGILGSVMIGTLLASSVKVNIILAPVIGGAEVPIQGILDSIFPGLLSVLLWWAVYKLLQKGLTPTKIIFSLMGICVILAFFGIF